LGKKKEAFVESLFTLVGEGVRARAVDRWGCRDREHSPKGVPETTVNHEDGTGRALSSVRFKLWWVEKGALPYGGRKGDKVAGIGE